MLKLQRISKSSDIAIRFRVREPIFTRQLSTALFITVALHLAMLFCIDIKAIRPPLFTARPPIVATADIGISTHAEASVTSLQVDKYGLLPRYILEPTNAIPSLPEITFYDVITFQADTSRYSDVTPSFSQLEAVPYRSSLSLHPYIAKGPPFKVLLSGPLASRKIKSQALQNFAKMYRDKTLRDYHIIKINIRIDDKTGEVFWTSLDEPSPKSSLNDLALDMVKSIRFNTKKRSFVTTGTIEVMLSSSLQNTAFTHEVDNVNHIAEASLPEDKR
jgi:hypothetical protein